MIKISFAADTAIPSNHSLVVTVAESQKLGKAGAKLDKKLGGLLKRAMKDGHFTGAADKTLTILSPAKTRLSRIILVGIGKADAVTDQSAKSVGGAAYVAVGGKEAQAALLADDHAGNALSLADFAANLGAGAKLRSFRFDKYMTKQKPEQKHQLKSISILSADFAEARRAYVAQDKVADAVHLARELVSEPGNVIFPDSLAAQCAELEKLGVEVEILDEEQMQQLGMGALLGIAQGSEKPPRLVTMTWTGDPHSRDTRPVALVGKGVTFDTGGISLKPAASLMTHNMKYDMAGSAAVIGTIKALAGRKAKANVVGVVGCVENMPDGNAIRPGDIVTSMSGQTVEVLNTDAEGRMVLADAVWYAQDQFNPRCVIDLATLTGAIIISLGGEYAGIFSNDDKLSDQLTAAGKAVDEKLWRFPLGDAYDKQLDSTVADMKNIGNAGEAGSITGAQFIKRFVKKGTPWAHLDIAGVADQGKDSTLYGKGATGFGVRLLDRFIADNFEAK